MNTHTRLLTLLTLCLAALAACGGDDGSEDTGIVVTFVYQAPTALDPDVAAAFPSCVDSVGATHLHPSWRDYQRFNMRANGPNEWRLPFSAVPAGTHRFRINDPNVCTENATGAVTVGIFANGVELTNVVDTPGGLLGTEPGLSFTVAADGTVTP